MIPKRIVKERIYVTVTSTFDSTGYMQPIAITWADGRVFKIDTVTDFCPADTVGLSIPGDCYTVVIAGHEKHLFFERTDTRFRGRFGRWFVEGAAVR